MRYKHIQNKRWSIRRLVIGRLMFEMVWKKNYVDTEEDKRPIERETAD